MNFKKLCVLVMALALVVPAGFVAAGTLDDVKAKGYISVGVNEGLFGFSKPDEKGEWRGLDVDTARAISAAMSGCTRLARYGSLVAIPHGHFPV